MVTECSHTSGTKFEEIHSEIHDKIAKTRSEITKSSTLAERIYIHIFPSGASAGPVRPVPETSAILDCMESLALYDDTGDTLVQKLCITDSPTF